LISSWKLEIIYPISWMGSGFEVTLNWFILCLPVQLLGLITAEGLSEFLIHLWPRRFVSLRPWVGLCTFDDILL
jgi:hypothetical protein